MLPGMYKEQTVATVIHKDEQAFVALNGRWEAIVAQSADLTFFACRPWHRCWWRAVGRHQRNHSLHVLEFVEVGTGASVGIIPLMRVREAHGDVLRSHSYPYADYFDVLVAPDSEQACAKAFAEHLRALAGSIVEVELHSVRRLSPTYRMLTDSAIFPHVRVEPSRPCPIVDLGDEKALEKATGKRTTRLKSNRLRRLGKVEVRHIETAEDIGREHERFVALHTARWGENPEAVGLFTDPSVLRFFAELNARLPRDGLLLLSTLSLDGAPIAMYYGFQMRGHYYYYRSCFDLDYAHLSPGHILLESLLCHCVDKGLTTFDFLRGDYAYKSRYSCKDVENVDLMIGIL